MKKTLHELISDLVDSASEYENIKPTDDADEKFKNVVLESVSNYKKVKIG